VDEGKEIGRGEGRGEGIEIAIAIAKFAAKGMPASEIAATLGLDIALVQRVIASGARDSK
jgi:predicted transposase YdaD